MSTELVPRKWIKYQNKSFDMMFKAPNRHYDMMEQYKRIKAPVESFYDNEVDLGDEIKLLGAVARLKTSVRAFRFNSCYFSDRSKTRHRSIAL